MESRLEELAVRLVEKSAPEALALKDDIADVATGVDALNATVEEVRAENATLMSGNNTLIKQNESLTMRLCAMKQYSLINNIYSNEIPCS